MQKDNDAAAAIADGAIDDMLAAIAGEPEGKIEWEFERPFDDDITTTAIKLGLIEEELMHFAAWSERTEIRLTKEGWIKLGLPMPEKPRSILSRLLRYVMATRKVLGYGV